MSLWLVGTGPMAVAQAKVLSNLMEPFTVIGRGEKSAGIFAEKTGITPSTGGAANILKKQTAPLKAIVAVDVDGLADVAIALMQSGTKKILLEKPGGLNVRQIEKIHQVAKDNDTDVLIGYNRRFYSSTLKAEEIIAEDGGIRSVQFEFTEWASKVKNLSIPSIVKEQWLICNSSHVIDLVFFLCGRPVSWNYWSNGSLDWHPSGSHFCGAGTTTQEVMFSYIADWQSSGRWGIEIFTPKRRLVLRPMEQLQAIALNSTELMRVKLEDELDRNFKPGIHKQLEAFLCNDTSRFCTLSQQAKNIKFYSQMGGYSYG